VQQVVERAAHDCFVELLARYHVRLLGTRAAFERESVDARAKLEQTARAREAEFAMRRAEQEAELARSRQNLEEARVAVEREAARVVVIDSLNGYLNAMPEERFLTIQLHEVLTYLGQQGAVTLMVVAQRGLLGSGMQTPVDASYLADTVIALRYFEAGGQLRRAISVVKKRSGAHEDTLREMRLSHGGVALGEPLHDFHGVMSGIPVIAKEDGDLARR